MSRCLKTIKQFIVDCSGKSTQQVLTEIIFATYNISDDDKTLRASVETFEKQRGAYPVRREFPYYEVKLLNGSPEINSIVSGLGFCSDKIKNRGDARSASLQKKLRRLSAVEAPCPKERIYYQRFYSVKADVEAVPEIRELIDKNLKEKIFI